MAQAISTVCILRVGISVQGSSLPLFPSLSLSPCIFTKVAVADLVPLKEVGIHILNYLDNWLILALSENWFALTGILSLTT